MSAADVHARLLERLRRNQHAHVATSGSNAQPTQPHHQRAVLPPCAPERPLHSALPGAESIQLSMACHSHFAATRMRALIESVRASEPPLEIDSEFEGVAVRRLAPQTDEADWCVFAAGCF